MSTISRASILGAFAHDPCLELRHLASRHGVSIDCQNLLASLSTLERDGCVKRLGGKGRRAVFVLSSFDY